jgi:hypothetical protein
MELLLVGWATSRPITNLPMMVWDQDISAESRSIITSLINTGTFSLYTYAHNMDEIEEAHQQIISGTTRGKIVVSL